MVLFGGWVRSGRTPEVANAKNQSHPCVTTEVPQGWGTRLLGFCLLRPHTRRPSFPEGQIAVLVLHEFGHAWPKFLFPGDFSQSKDCVITHFTTRVGQHRSQHGRGT